MPDTQPDTTTEIVRYEDEIGIDRFQRRPIIDRIDARQLDLIRRTLAVAEGEQAITHAEIGHFLELCALYGLDPFAREAWIAKSKTGKLLIMVGRAGLRKVADRNGLRVRTDVICAKDHFTSEFIDSPSDAKDGEWEAHGGQPFHRIEHKKNGITSQARGAVAGAWSRVTDRATGVEVGYFDAPISEYKPVNVSTYSPWSKQESAMMQGAVERQSIGQATPLGGLMAQGEDESANASRTAVGAGQGSGEGPGWGDMPVETVRAVMNVIERARELKHAGLSDLPTIQQRLNGQPAEVVAQWVEDSTGVLDGMAEPEPPDAEVVEDEPAPADAPSLTFGGQTFLIDRYKYPITFTRVSTTLDDGGADECEKMAIELLEASEGFSDELLIDQYRLMAEAMHSEAESRRGVNEGQTEIEF